MIAALQMYDWPEVHPRMDAFWAALSANLTTHGIEAPLTLSRPDRLSEPWTRPDLLLGQTCGLPYVAGRCGDAVLVARPDFGLDGARDGNYASALICRADDPATSLSGFRGRIAAINEYGSQSGCNALADAVLDVHADAQHPFFATVSLSGAHRNSARMVAKGQCDVAAIDAVAWALFAELEPEHHAKLRVIAWTRPMPALPFITSPVNASRIDALREALAATCHAHADQSIPIPQGVLKADDSDYDAIRQMAKRVQGLQMAKNSPALGL